MKVLIIVYIRFSTEPINASIINSRMIYLAISLLNYISCFINQLNLNAYLTVAVKLA